MHTRVEDLKRELKEKKIGLSHQRLMVLEYVTLNECHPTVDEIYKELHDSLSTLSKTTVYNTLKVLVDAGIVRVIDIDENEARYDINTHDHGHFMCNSCRKIYDFPVDMSLVQPPALANFEVSDKNVYFRGVCPGCL